MYRFIPLDADLDRKAKCALKKARCLLIPQKADSLDSRFLPSNKKVKAGRTESGSVSRSIREQRL